MKRSLRQIADAVHARLIGGDLAEIDGVSSLEAASQHDLVFVDDEKHLAAALKSQAGAIIAGEFAASANSDRPLLITDHPKLAFARAAQMLRDEPQPSGGKQTSVDAAAIIHPSAVLGTGVRV
jgi:UDP-3-O-[3-hydroxymyristoyl] glucosamine N-acyltransferase